MNAQTDLSGGAESLAMFEVALPSEISSLLNVLVLDVVFLPFIMCMSGKLAGYVNTSMLGNGASSQ